MNLRPDFDRTATGYLWLDKLTAPFWNWMVRRADRLFEKEVGASVRDILVPPLENPGFDVGGLEGWVFDDEPDFDSTPWGDSPPDDFLIPYLPEDDNRPPDRRP